MTLVTNSNFDAMFPEIESLLTKASFIAVDTEFTGLVASQESKPSLFDSPEARYNKLRQAASSFIICQLGLVPFLWDEKQNCYTAHRFLFYICPRSSMASNPLFSFQSSAVEFLCVHNFDFNKFAYEGIPYLNKKDEEMLRENFANGSAFLPVYEDIDAQLMQEKLSAVSAWLVKAADGETLILEKGKVPQLQCHVLITELRNNFPNIWVSSTDNDKILIEKVQPEMHASLEKSCHDEAQLINSFVGFSRVFQMIVKCEKPLVGHNMFMDLVLLFQHFHRPLPSSFKKFKQELLQLFPAIYDTKYIFQQNRKMLDEKSPSPLLSLSSLYQFLSSQGYSLTLYYPQVKDICCPRTRENSFHEAGYDAYAAGFVFVRLLHVIASTEQSISELRPLLWRELERAAQPYRNRINLIRGSCHHVNLSGEDPPSGRIQLLHITAKNSCLNPVELAQKLSKCGVVDIKMLSAATAVVATASFYTARDVYQALTNDKNLSVAKYSSIRHHKQIRCLLWATLFATGLLSCYMVCKLKQ